MATKQTAKKRETKKNGDVIKAVREQLGLYLYHVDSSSGNDQNNNKIVVSKNRRGNLWRNLLCMKEKNLG